MAFAVAAFGLLMGGLLNRVICWEELHPSGMLAQVLESREHPQVACKSGVSIRSLALGLLTTFLLLLDFSTMGRTAAAALAGGMIFFGLAVSAFDLQYNVIPNQLVGLGLLLALGMRLAFWQPVLPALLAGVAAGGFLYVTGMVYRGAIGGGDVKLAVVLGMFLGWPGVLTGLLFGLLAAALSGLVLVALGRRRFKETIPLGPFLVAGALAAFWWGAPAVTLYAQWAGVR